MKLLGAAVALLAILWGQAPAQTVSGIAPVLQSTPPMGSSTGPAPAGIPLGSTELSARGESPVILPLGTAFPSQATGQQTPGIPLGGNLPTLASGLAGTAVGGPATAGQSAGANCAVPGGLSGTLPQRLFSGSPAMGPQASGASGCVNSAAAAIPNGSTGTALYRPRAGGLGIPLGASELANSGTAGVVQASPALPGY
jgi:hypothetical protein